MRAIYRTALITPQRITATLNGTGFDTQNRLPSHFNAWLFGFFLTATVTTLRLEHSDDNVTFVFHPDSPGGASGFAASAAGVHINLDPAVTKRYVRAAVTAFTGTDSVVGAVLMWSDN